MAPPPSADSQPDYSEYSTFATPNFDPNDYANSILAGDTYPPTQKKGRVPSDVVSANKEDISVALGKLGLGIEDVAKQLRNVVTTHHEALLSEASSIHELEGSVQSVREGLIEIETSLEKLRLKIRVPYQTLSSHVKRLYRLQLAADVLRRTARFVLVARRLELQMTELDKVKSTAPDEGGKADEEADTMGQEGERERTLAKAALSIAELISLAPPESQLSTAGQEAPVQTIDAAIPLRSINTVVKHLPIVETARTRVTDEMDTMIQLGLESLNQSTIGSAFQTAHNLRVLPSLIQDIVEELTAHTEEQIKDTFDVAKIAKEIGVKESPAPSTSLIYRSRVRTEPTNATAPQWSTALWARLEALIEDLTDSCIKIYTVEKVLKLKKDSVLKIPFMEEAMKVLESKPSSSFWMTTARGLENRSRDASKGSPFVQQTLSNGYPRLLRLFHDFFAKIGLHTDTVYTESHQSPETVLVLRSISSFEALYLSRSLNRMNEAVGAAVSGGTRAPPGSAEGTTIARTVTNELDSARFDPLLVRSVAKNVVTAVDSFVQRVEAMVARDRASTSLVGPHCTPQLALNAQLVSALYNCWLRLNRLDLEYHASVVTILDPAIKNLKRAHEKICDPLIGAIRRDLSSIIARLHRVDFGGGKAGIGGASSPYMIELVEKLSFIRSEVFSRFVVGDMMKEWIVSMAQKVIRAFVLHASIVKPLDETGKLQLTSDMTELEFAISAFVTERSGVSGGGSSGTTKKGMKLDVIAEDYRALRALRPLLFSDNSALDSADERTGLPPLIVLHHIFVRSPMPLPHVVHGWKPDEYVRWVEEHTEQEAFTLVDGCLKRWEATSGDDETAAGADFVRLAGNVFRLSA